MKEENKGGANPFNVFDNRVSQGQLNMVTSYTLNRALIRKEEINVKDIYHFPASLQQAQLHQNVNKYGYRSPVCDSVNERGCACCGHGVNIEEVGMCADLTPLKEEIPTSVNEPRQLSADTALFFQFIKMTIVYVLLKLLCEGLKLLFYSQSQFCTTNPGSCSISGLLQLLEWPQARFGSMELLQIESFINLIFVILAIFFFLYYRFLQNRYYWALHSDKYSQDNYTVLVENIPFFPFLQVQQSNNPEKMPQYYDLLRLSFQNVNISEVVQTSNANIVINEALRLFFDKQANKWRSKVERAGVENIKNLTDLELSLYEKIKHVPGENFKPVKSITLCFDLSDLQKVAQLREKIMEQHLNSYDSSQYVDQKSRNYLPNQVNLLAQKEIQIQKQYATTTNQELTLTHFLGSALVSFQLEEMKDFFLTEHPDNLKLLYDDVSCMQISQSPAVDDIYWFRLNNDEKQIARSVARLGIFTGIIVSGLLSLMWLIQYWKLSIGLQVVKFDSSNSMQVSPHGFIFIVAVVFIIDIMNTLLGKAVDHFVDVTGFKTKSQEVQTKILKKVTAYFIFVAGAISIISDYWTASSGTWNQVAAVIILLIAKEMIVKIVGNSMQWGRLWQLLKLKCFYSQDKANTFQIYLNKLFQFKQFDIAERYSFYIVWLFVVSAFTSVAAFNIFVLLLAFPIFYWLDKCNLLRRNSNPTSLTKHLSLLMLQIFQFDIIIFAVGNLVTLSSVKAQHLTVRDSESQLNRFFHLHLSYQKIAVLALIIAAVYKVIMIILSKFFIGGYQSKRKSYTESQNLFRYKYWTENPASKFAEQGKFTAARVSRQRTTGEYYQNLSLPVAEVKLQLGHADGQVQNLEEIDLSKPYSTKPKVEESSGIKSSGRRRVPNK